MERICSEEFVEKGNDLHFVKKESSTLMGGGILLLPSP